MRRTTGTLGKLLLANAPAESSGFIEGTVAYEDGRPVKGATVTAMPLGVPLATLIPQAETDEKGHFSIRPLWLVRYAVGAKKEDKNYADTTMQFYSDGAFQTVTLTDDHPTATIAIRLGPKAGVLMGTVADAVTGAPLMPCVELIRALEPKNFLWGGECRKSGPTGFGANFLRCILPPVEIVNHWWLREHC